MYVTHIPAAFNGKGKGVSVNSVTHIPAAFNGKEKGVSVNSVTHIYQQRLTEKGKVCQ